MKLPAARNKDIAIQELESETLVYDLITDKAYVLNETSSIVFNACGTNKTFSDLKTSRSFDADLIYLTLEELKKTNLLTDDYVSPFKGISRREVIRKVGLA